MSWPTSADSLPAPVDGVSEVVANDILLLAAGIDHLQTGVGLIGDPASSSGSIYARLANLEASNGGIFKQASAPSSPATDDLWLDTDDTGRPLYDFRSAAWALIGANALKVQGVAVDTTAPTDGQVFTYDVGSGKWGPADATGGMDNPLTTEWGILVGGTVVGGVAAPAQLPLGTTVGQVLGVVAGPALGYISLNYMPIPSGTIGEGVFPLYTGGAWTAQGPGSTSGYAWTSNGPGATPSWQAIPVSPPGSGMAVPSSPRVGAVISYNESGDPYWLLPGAAGTVLTAHGDNNIAGSKLTWVAPSSGGASLPFTTTGDTLYSSDNSGTAARLPIATSNAANKFYGISGGAPAWKALDGTVIGTYLDFTYGSAPSTPAASTGRLYAKSSTGKVYFKNAVGTEYDLTGGGGGSSFYQAVRNATNTADMTGRGTLRFTGTALNSITDDSGNDATIINYDTPGVFGASGGGHTTGVVPDPGSSAGSTRFLREDATWATPSGGGGGGGSRLALSSTGLIADFDFQHKADATLSSTPDADGWAVRTTYDAGTWIFRNGRLVNTGHGNYDRLSNMAVSNRDGVYEVRGATPSQAGHYIGHRFLVQSGADTDFHTLQRTADRQLNSRAAGSNTSIATGTDFTAISAESFSIKTRFTYPGSVRTLAHWLNNVSKYVGTSSTGPTAAGGIGLVVYPNGSGLDTEFARYSVYSDTVVTVTGLSGTQAWRLYSAGGTLIGSSGTQSGGSATVDTATACLMPLWGHMQVFTDNSYVTPESGASRFPAEGEAIIWGGDSFLFT